VDQDQRMRASRRHLIAVVTLLLVAGCGTNAVIGDPFKLQTASEPGPQTCSAAVPAATSATSVAPLGNYVVDHIELTPSAGGGGGDYELTTMSFDGAILKVCGPCRQWRGSYTPSAGGLTVSELLRIQRDDCVGAMRTPYWIEFLARQRDMLRVSGANLTVSLGERTLTMRRTELSLDWPLEGTQWRLVAGLVDSSLGWQPTKDERTTLAITSGRLTVSDACASSSAAVSAADGLLTLDHGTTRGAVCTDPGRAVQKTLPGNAQWPSGKVAYTVSGPIMILGAEPTGAGDQLAFVAEPIAALVFPAL
jgi:hypothetical protein